MSANGDTAGMLWQVYDAADFGRAIRIMRVRRGWTQAELAEWLGVHRVTVAKLEHGGTVDLPLAIRALALLGAAATIHARTVSVKAVGDV